jgi:hypothetical protein
MLFVSLAVAQSVEDPMVTITRREIKTTKTFRPIGGYVPDSATAVALAVAILKPIYGETEINSDKPWLAGLKDGVWTVVGTFHGEGPGGTGVIQLDKRTGAILFVGHTQ